MPVVEVKSVEDFNKLFQSDKKYVFVDFHAQWCGPCKKIAPKIEQLSEQYKNICFCKVDVDQVPELSQQYSVSTLPTFIMFEVSSKKQLYDKVVGSNIQEVNKLLNVCDFSIDNMSNNF